MLGRSRGAWVLVFFGGGGELTVYSDKTPSKNLRHLPVSSLPPGVPELAWLGTSSQNFKLFVHMILLHRWKVFVVQSTAVF